MTIEAQLADGRTLQFPDGTDPTVVQATVKRVVSGQVATPGAGNAGTPPPQAPGVGAPEAPPLLARIGHGASNITSGLQQLYYMATGDDAKLKQLTDQRNDEEALYQKGRGPNAGIDWASMLGEAGMMAPAALVSAPASVPGRLALAGGIGAAQGASEFAPEGTVAGKAKNTAIGAVAGPVAQGATELAAPVVGKVVQKVAQGATAAKNLATGATSNQAAQSAVSKAIGQDTWNALDAATQDALTSRAQSILARGRELDPEALLRQADINAVGAKGTTGAITRDPSQWYWEQEAAKLRGPNGDVGAPLVQRFQEDNQALMAQLPGMRPTNAPSGYDAAEAAREAVQGFSKQSQKDVASLYDAAGAQGADVPFDGASFMEKVRPIVETYEDKISGPVMKRLREFDAGLQMDTQGSVADGTTARAFTVDEATKLYKLINDSMGGEPGGVGRAANALKAALMDVGTSGPATQPAMGAFQQATNAARQRFQTLEPRTIATLNDTNEAPVNFIEQMITGKKPGEIAALRDVVQKQQPDAWNGVKATTLDWLQRKATLNDPEGKFSGKRFGDALDQIGQARLQEIFEPAELAQLGTIKRASYALTREPPYAAVNHSNSGSTFANLVNNRLVSPAAVMASHAVPVLGPMALGALATGREVMQDAARASAAKAAASPGLSAIAPTRVDPRAVRQWIARLLTYGTPAATAGATGALNAPGTGAP